MIRGAAGWHPKLLNPFRVAPQLLVSRLSHTGAAFFHPGLVKTIRMGSLIKIYLPKSDICSKYTL
jgi:hypothetical protein